MAEDKAEGQVKGMKEAMSQAEKGLALLEAEKSAEIQFDSDAGAKYKAEIDAEIAKLQEEEAKLTGKDNKKARSELGKKVMNMKNEPKYIDACKAAKGLPPIHGNFVVGGGSGYSAKVEAKAAAAASDAPGDAGKDKKDDKKKEKKQDSAGISKAERDELEALKNQIIDRKKALKEQGMSGGQMNKDEEIVKWVARMNELKEKECPGSTAKDAGKKDGEGKKKKALSAEAEKNLSEKKQAFEEYADKLRNEFKYSKKEIAADPDYQEMAADIAKVEKRG